MSEAATGNIDPRTVDGFGDEWDAFDQSGLSEAEHEQLFFTYFGIFPFESLPDDAEGFDLGCGSGRWAMKVAPRVGTLHCIDPAEAALAVAKRRMADLPNARFHHAGVDAIPLDDGSQDFGYSLGVLHHIPDTSRAMADCVRKLKSGAPFLVYLYYRFDDRPWWFRAIWRASDLVRRFICRLPFGLRRLVTEVIAALVYWPLARGAALLEKLGMNVSNLPLANYRAQSFYTMRTDALDRFGTRLEQRFTKPEIVAMMEQAGLANIRFSDGFPFWVACGTKR
ncbi:MAG: class I SAM-dependent methyltransferase [Blastomonas sp.]